jgi:SAM-dependent methyltransferase
MTAAGNDEGTEALYGANRALWDERVGVHLGPGGYDLSALRAGQGRLDAVIEPELTALVGEFAGKRVIHLQCHVGDETLSLAQRGAEVVGIDFSPAAVAAASGLAAELGLAGRARFVECSLYDAPGAVGEAGFDLVLVTWGAIYWLPDVRRWAEVVAQFLRPGGRLYMAEGHPSALVFDDQAVGTEAMPGWFAPYFEPGPLAIDEAEDYSNPAAKLAHVRSYSWMHPLSETLTALLEAGLALRFFHEHAAVPWRMFRALDRGADRMWRWPSRPWLPLGFSLAAEKA